MQQARTPAKTTVNNSSIQPSTLTADTNVPKISKPIVSSVVHQKPVAISTDINLKSLIPPKLNNTNNVSSTPDMTPSVENTRAKVSSSTASKTTEPANIIERKADMNLIHLPLPELIQVTNLSKTLQHKGVVDFGLCAFETLHADTKRLADEIRQYNTDLYQDYELARASQPRDETQQSTVLSWVRNWWNSTKKPQSSNTTTTTTTTTTTIDNDTMDETSSTLTTTTDIDSAQVIVNDASVTSVGARLQRAIQLLHRWRALHVQLSANPNYARSNELFHSVWKSGFDQQTYRCTSLVRHIAMWAILCASLAFNLGRMAEVLGQSIWRNSYEFAFRIFYFDVYMYLRHSPAGPIPYRQPPELSDESCFTLQRTCLMKLQTSFVLSAAEQVYKQVNNFDDINAVQNAQTIVSLLHGMSLQLQRCVHQILPSEYSLLMRHQYRVRSLHLTNTAVINSLATSTAYMYRLSILFNHLALMYFHHQCTMKAQQNIDARQMHHRAAAKYARACLDECIHLSKSIATVDMGNVPLFRLHFTDKWPRHVRTFFARVVRHQYKTLKNADSWSLSVFDDVRSKSDPNNVSDKEFQEHYDNAMKDTESHADRPEPKPDTRPRFYFKHVRELFYT